MAVQAVKYQSKNLQAWNLLGLCQTSMGDIGDGIRAYQKVIDLQTDHREAWVNMAQARKEVSPHDVRSIRHRSLTNLQHICHLQHCSSEAEQCSRDVSLGVWQFEACMVTCECSTVISVSEVHGLGSMLAASIPLHMLTVCLTHCCHVDWNACSQHPPALLPSGAQPC